MTTEDVFPGDNLTTVELARLTASKSMDEWDAVCDDIKKLRNDQYPPDWWERVMVSGLSKRVAASWGVKNPGELHIAVGDGNDLRRVASFDAVTGERTDEHTA